MARNRKFGNDTLDVLNKGCLDLYDNVACGRINILALISLATFFLILLKIIKYHGYKHSQMHHYAIFYVSGMQCIACAASFILGVRYPQLDFGANFFKLVQFILICHLHWSAAARSRHRDDIVHHVVNPVLSLYALYCTTVVLMGMVDITNTWTECLRPYWLMLSSADFISVQLFAVVALYLTHSNKHSASVLMLPCTSSQTRDLWLITAVYEVSAVVSIVFDAVMSLMGREETGCSGIYDHVQVYYSSLVTAVTILKYFLPTWTLLCVFQPIRRVKSRPSEVALTSHYNNTDGTCYNQHHRMLFPQTNGFPNTLPFPTIPYTSESPIYGSFGDFSYTDSSPDGSPTIVRCWPEMEENTYGGVYEKHFVNMDHLKDNIIMDNQFRMDKNCQNLEKTLELDFNIMNNDDIDNIQNRNLSTIKEEVSNNVDSLQE